MPIERAKIRRLLYRNRDEIGRIRVHLDYKIRSLRRWLYYFLSEEGYPDYADTLRGIPLSELVEELRVVALPPRSDDVARRILRDVDLIASIDELELYPEDVRKLGDEELLDRAIKLKSTERDFLEEFAHTIREYIPEHPEWANEAEEYLERVKKRLKELKAMRVIFLVLQSRMFYRYERKKYTPQPFCFLALKVFTRSPEDWPEDLLKSALDFLTFDPEAFSYGGWGLGAALSEHAAYFEDGRDVRLAEPEEVEEPLDLLRYCAVFYRVKGKAVYIYREYQGYLTYEEGRWVIHPEWDKTRALPKEPSWDEAPRTEEVGP